MKKKNNIDIDYTKDVVMSELSLALLEKHYLIPGEKSPQDMFARSAINFCYGDYELAQRIYDYVSKGWANFSSPIASNSIQGTWKDKNTFIPLNKSNNIAQPISCFVQYIPDTIAGQIEASKELSWLSISGGGVGQVLGMRGITDKSPGAIPYFKTTDSTIMYYHQAGTRRGSIAGYLDISHPDIQEFIGVRNPTGGDVNRKCLNSNIGVNITDKFINAYENDLQWDLISPNNGEIVDTISARELWQTILETRFKTGEPYLHNITESNKHFPDVMKKQGFSVKGSNICSEIILNQDADHTSVCCLSSLNLEYYDEWKDSTIVEDFTIFLDNVLQWFIDHAPKELHRAIRSAKGSRDIGIGTMGWHYYLMKNNIAFESGGIGSAAQLSNTIFKNIKDKALAQSKILAKERGVPEYLKSTDVRNGHLLAVAPNANCVSPDTKILLKDNSIVCYSEIIKRLGLDLEELLTIEVFLEDGSTKSIRYDEIITVIRKSKEIEIEGCELLETDDII